MKWNSGWDRDDRAYYRGVCSGKESILWEKNEIPEQPPFKLEHAAFPITYLNLSHLILATRFMQIPLKGRTGLLFQRKLEWIPRVRGPMTARPVFPAPPFSSCSRDVSENKKFEKRFCFQILKNIPRKTEIYTSSWGLLYFCCCCCCCFLFIYLFYLILARLWRDALPGFEQFPIHLQIFHFFLNFICLFSELNSNF